jgi:hypothetical protein
VGVAVGTGVEVAVGRGVCVAVGVSVAVAVAVLVSVTVGVAVAVALAVADASAAVAVPEVCGVAQAASNAPTARAMIKGTIVTSVQGVVAILTKRALLPGPSSANTVR